jgi:hypothetical protein
MSGVASTPLPSTPSDRSQVRKRWAGRTLATIAMGTLVVVALWMLLSLILASDRGLDITDEGLYLLAADPPSAIAHWGFPWGWHAAPLFALVGHDIAAFRTAGAVLLVLAGAWLGRASVAGAMTFRGSRHTTPCRARLLALAGAGIGGVGSLLYYQGLLRTPSYNWVNLIGILIAAAALVSLLARLQRPSAHPAGSLLLAAAAGIGMFVTLPAKPTTAAILLALEVVMLVVVVGWRSARFAVVSLAAAVASLAVAVALGLWPSDFPDVFASAIAMPRGSGQGTIAALALLLTLPGEIVTSFIDLGAVLAVGASLVGILLAAALLPGVAQRPWLRVLGIVTATAGALLALAAGLSSYAELDLPPYAIGALVTACLVMIAACAGLVRADPQTPERAGLERGGERVRVAALLGYLLVLPFVFSLGSAWRPYETASEAAVLLLIAATVALVMVRGRRLQAFGLACLVTFTVVSTGAVLWQSHQQPFKSRPIARDVVPLQVGTHGSSLLVDPDLAAVVTSLKAQAAQNGWVPGSPMVGTVWTWTSTVPYALGARVPESLMLTLLGSDVTEEIARFNVQLDADEYPYADAWVLTTPDANLDAAQREEIARVQRVLDDASGLTFPEDYACVAAAGNFRLWRPSSGAAAGAVGPGVANGSCPSPVPAESAYWG